VDFTIYVISANWLRIVVLVRNLHFSAIEGLNMKTSINGFLKIVSIGFKSSLRFLKYHAINHNSTPSFDKRIP